MIKAAHLTRRQFATAVAASGVALAQEHTPSQRRGPMPEVPPFQEPLVSRRDELQGLHVNTRHVDADQQHFRSALLGIGKFPDVFTRT